MEKNFLEQGYDEFILGHDPQCVISTDCCETQLNNNIMVVGGSGSGKTTSVMNPILLHLQHSNAIGVFTKKGMMDEAARVLKKRGYNVCVIDFVEPKSSSFGYDPLLHCQNDRDYKALAHSVIHAGGKSLINADSFWEDSAENVLEAVLRLVGSGHYAGGHSMQEALYLLERIHDLSDDCSDWDALDAEEREKAEQEYPLHAAFEKIKAVDPVGYDTWKSLLCMAMNTGSGILASLKTPLQNLFNTDIRKVLKQKKQFDFNALTKPKTILFVYISPVNMVHHRFISIFYEQAFKNLFEIAEKMPNHCLPYPVHVLCDDFATGCKIPDFTNLISIFREKRISVTMLLQSETQLESMYGKMEAKTIINNCDTYLYLGGMDLDTIQQIAKRIDKPYAEVQNMPVGQEYFFRRGQKPIVTKRYNLFDDPIYLKEIAGRART